MSIEHPKKILHDAVVTISERGKQYPDFKNHFEDVSRRWSAHLGVYVKPSDIPIMLAELKFSRMEAGLYKEDNYVDAIGYIALAAEVKRAEGNAK